MGLIFAVRRSGISVDAARVDPGAFFFGMVIWTLGSLDEAGQVLLRIHRLGRLS
jgi:hypothetical protein